MFKSRLNFHRFFLVLSGIFLVSISSCENPVSPTNPVKPPVDNTPKTRIEFKNLEQYPVTIYSDSLRQNVFTEVAAKDTKTVPAEPNLIGIAFYPTFSLVLTELLGNIIPYDAPSIVTAIEANTTNKVMIPELESIEFSSAYITITNADIFPLTFRQGNNELPPMGVENSSTIILPSRSTAYKITPGSVSGYSIMKNTNTPIVFPPDFIEFKKGVIYIFTYNGTNLTLEEKTVRQIVFPPPKSFQIASVTENSIGLTWNAVNKASGYNVYRSAIENGTYDKVNTGIITSTGFIDTGLDAYTAYYYKISAIYKGGFEEIQQSPIFVSTGLIVQGNNFAAKLDWLKTNVVSNYLYVIEVDSNESLVPQNLYYSGKSGITIILKGSGAMRTITLSASGSLFTISGVTLILDNNITLNGRNNNTSSLIYVSTNGTMIMNAGSKITGNTCASTDVSAGGGVRVEGNFIMNGGEISNNKTDIASSKYSFSLGGGVYVNGTGTFTMNDGKISGNSAGGGGSGGGGVCVDSVFIMKGGEISGNTASGGGGVCVDGRMGVPGTGSPYGATFRMSGGVIFGSNVPSTSLRNTATSEGGAALFIADDNRGYGYKEYGTFDDKFYKSGNFTTTNTTIRIVNGNLQTN